MNFNKIAVCVTALFMSAGAHAQSEQSLLTTQKPAQKGLSDGRAVNYELGVRFMSDVKGKIKAIRFFKDAKEGSAVHEGRIYSASGALLAKVKFTGESASGWQRMNLSAALSIEANKEYVVSVNTGRTYYVATNDGFNSQIKNGSLKSIVGNNGVYGSVGQMPRKSWRNSNYFRDVVFVADAATPAPTPDPTPTPTPDPDPTPVPPPSTGAYPDATNTGIPAGTVLTKFSGTMYVTTAGAVVSNMDITGNIVVEADNVTIKNCKITSNTPYHLIYVIDGHKGFKLQNSELYGKSSTVNGVLGEGTFIGNKIMDFDNGLNIWGGLVQDNYIYMANGTADGHFDGIEINAGTDIKIVHNTVIVDAGQTSAIMMNNYFGEVARIEIDNNRLVGGGYTIYLDYRFGGGPVDHSSVKVTNNRLGRGYYGYFAFYDKYPVVSGNVDDVTGKAVAP